MSRLKRFHEILRPGSRVLTPTQWEHAHVEYSKPTSPRNEKLRETVLASLYVAQVECLSKIIGSKISWHGPFKIVEMIFLWISNNVKWSCWILFRSRKYKTVKYPYIKMLVQNCRAESNSCMYHVYQQLRVYFIFYSYVASKKRYFCTKKFFWPSGLTTIYKKNKVCQL